MVTTSALIERLLTVRLPAALLIAEAADKYTPLIGDLNIALADGRTINVFDLDPMIAQYVTGFRSKLRREDRIVWALRFYKKALIYELLWMVHYDQKFLEKKFGAPPAPEQSLLDKKYRNLSDIDITPFELHDPEDPENPEPAYLGFDVANTILDRVGHFMDVDAKMVADFPTNAINTYRFERQPFGEVISALRAGEIYLRKKSASGINIWPVGTGAGILKDGGITYWSEPGDDPDLEDTEGTIKTIIKFPNGWRWFDLQRNCSEIRSDLGAPADTAITGHCANTASKGNVTVLELAEPIKGNLWKHHAMFVLKKNGMLGEMKGRKNQKPGGRLHTYIVELLKKEPRIKGLEGGGAEQVVQNNFQFRDLPPEMLADLFAARPDIFPTGYQLGQNADLDQQPEDE